MSIINLKNGETFGFTTSYNKIVNVLKTEVFIAQSFDPKNISSHPTPRKYKALWDTGATGSCITNTVVNECGLLPIGMADIAVFGGTRRSNVYLISVGLPNKVGFPELTVTEGNILGADMLIGMNIISKGDFALTNYGGKTMLSFRIPSIGSVDLKDHSPGAKYTSPVPKSLIAKSPKVGRNAPCPCGSGKKYKKCCGK